MVIDKYPLQIIDKQTILLPSDAIILSVQTINAGVVPLEDNNVFLYAMVDPNYEPKLCEIQIYGTGHEIGTDIGQYINTFQMFNGNLIFHTFISDKSEKDGFSVRT